MLKNKLRIVLILMILILCIMVPFVKAENDVMPISEDAVAISEDQVTEEAPATSSSEDTSFKKGDIYLIGDDITIDYIIDGNLFIIADKVTINSQIGGDAFICANSIIIEDEGYIFSNLFALSDNLDINGVVYDLYACCQNVNISGYVYRDIRVNSGSLNIFGKVGRNAFVNCNTISLGNPIDMQEGEATTITTQGSISGDLNYTAPTESSLPDDSVTGNINFTKSSSYFSVNELFLSLGSVISSVLIIWLLCLWLAPKFLKNTSSLLSTKKVLPVIGLGITTPIVLIIAMVILFIIGITSSIALLALTLLFTLMIISSSLFVISINSLICKILKIEKTIGILGMLIVSSIALWALKLIPYASIVISLITTVLGLGIIVYSLVFKNSKESKKSETIA